MTEGDVVLVALPQADTVLKNRPAIFLRQMPPFGDLLVCGVSTQLHQEVKGFDDLVLQQDADFALSGLVAESLIRLGFLAIFPQHKVLGSIGKIGAPRHRRLLGRLAEYLLERIPNGFKG